MPYDRQKVIDLALSQVGYLEKASNAELDSFTANAGDKNWTKYARDLDSMSRFYNGRKNGFAWCDVFVDWCFVQAYGRAAAQKLLCQPDDSAGAGCSFSAGYFRSKGQFYINNPQPGDQIFFGSGPNNVWHTGLVVSVGNNHVYTVEGNTTDSVGKRSYRLDDSSIYGYGRPNWNMEGGDTTVATDTKKIFHDFFIEKIGNEYGVAGLWGNIYAESAGCSNNLQTSYESKLGYSDETYTKAVDDGSYTNFVHDSAGYGLAQWTYYSRKQELLDFAKASGKSIGDFGMQIEFLWKELQKYARVIYILKNATSVKEASDAVMTQYERPKDTSDQAKNTRAKYGQDFYNLFAKVDPMSGRKTYTLSGLHYLKEGDYSLEVKNVQHLLIAQGYFCGGKIVNGHEIPDGEFGATTKAAVISFQTDMGIGVDGEIGPETMYTLLAR